MSPSEEPHASPMRVFISYSHDSPEHCDRVLALAQRLRHDGIDAWVDQFEESPGQGWPLWCVRQILDARYVLLICTELYRKRFLSLEEFGKGRGVNGKPNSSKTFSTTRRSTLASFLSFCMIRTAALFRKPSGMHHGILSGNQSVMVQPTRNCDND